MIQIVFLLFQNFRNFKNFMIKFRCIFVTVLVTRHKQKLLTIKQFWAYMHNYEIVHVYKVLAKYQNTHCNRSVTSPFTNISKQNWHTFLLLSLKISLGKQC